MEPLKACSKIADDLLLTILHPAANTLVAMSAVQDEKSGFKRFARKAMDIADREPILTIRRIHWIIVGGFVVALLFLFAGVILCITIVGIPMGVRAFRWALYVHFTSP